MRCREAKLRLTEFADQIDGFPLPIDLARHLKDCPECARLATAHRIVQQGFRDLREVPPVETTPLALVKARVSARTHQHRQKEPAIMKNLWNSLSLHPRLSLGFAAGLVAVVLMATIPISCSRTVGYSVEGTDVDPAARVASPGGQKEMELTVTSLKDGTVTNLTVRAEKIQDALQALGHENAHVEVDQTTGEQSIHIEGLQSHEEAREAALVLQRFARFDGDVSIEEQKARVKSSLLGHLANNIAEITVDADGKSDEQVEAEIRAELASRGIDFDVFFQTLEDGNTMIFLGNSGLVGEASTQLGGGAMMEWNVSDTGGGMRSIQLEGDGSLTPEEMQKAMAEQLKKQGINPENVKVRYLDSLSADTN